MSVQSLEPPLALSSSSSSSFGGLEMGSNFNKDFALGSGSRDDLDDNSTEKEVVEKKKRKKKKGIG